MRINRVETRAYVVSGDAEEEAKRHFRERARQLGEAKKTEVRIELVRKYTPLVVLAAVKQDMDGSGTQMEGMENRFHVGLKDACIYIFGKKGVMDKAKGSLVHPADAGVERVDLLLELATISPTALSTLGYLLDHGTVVFSSLEEPKQAGAKELAGRKLTDIYRPEDRESGIETAFRDILEMKRITPIYKVKAKVPVPRFMSRVYDLSSRLRDADVVEDGVELEKIVYAPEMLTYLLGTMFNCSIIMDKIVYIPYIECRYIWAGKQSTELRYVPCFKNLEPKKYDSPKRLKTIMLGTKGHGLQAMPVEDVAIDFTNVAGMPNVKESIREAIVYPLVRPELAKEFKSKAGGGVLFYGPPGCGKTYVMRATVGEAGVDFFSVGIQDIIGDDPEAAAARLDAAFNEAKAASPSILFFDEIDALGGSRKSAQKGAERRLVNQFLTNMEGVGSSSESVLVVGSTNSPWGMDPALRRAGRFTTQIFIPPPDEEARLALFGIHTKGRPMASDVNVQRLMELTENYSSADITAICDEAARIPWRESVHGGEKRPITMDDFLSVLNERESSLTPWLRLAEKQLRESGESELFPELSDYVFKRAGGIEMVQQPKMSFADVGDMEDVKEEIRNKVVYPLKQPELAREYGRTIGGGLLLYGPPGCGKTYIARATAGECAASFFNVKMTDLLSPEEGVTEKRLHSIFERASRNTPAIIFFDEVDAVAGQRTSSKGGAERRLINQFLTEMDGFEKTEGVMVLAATNAPWDMDPALRRAGRFSDQVFIPPPDPQGRAAVFKIHLDGRPVAEDVAYDELAGLTDGYSSADIKLICDEAAKIPWKESMEGQERRPVSMADFKAVISERKPSIGPWLKQAAAELGKSEEKDTYASMWALVKGAGQKGQDAGAAREIEYVKKEIELLKKKRDAGEVPDEVYNSLLVDYQKKLISLEAKL